MKNHFYMHLLFIYIYIYIYFLLLIVYWVIKEKLFYTVDMYRACSSQTCGLDFCMIHVLVRDAFYSSGAQDIGYSQAKKNGQPQNYTRKVNKCSKDFDLKK